MLTRFSRIINLRILGLLTATVVVSCSSSWRPSLRSREASVALPKAPKLVWISLDALHESNLRSFLGGIKNPHPRGLVWLLRQENAVGNLSVSFPSITASSHISTMTCSSPGTHGVFLNSGNWTGERDYSGFAMPYQTETWVQALRKDRKQVAVAAYPSVDGSSPERSADLGVAYDTPVGKVQYVTLSPSGEGSAEVPSHLISGKTYRFTFRSTLDQKIVVSSDFGAEVELPEARVADVFGDDGLGGQKRRAAVSFLNLGMQSGQKATVVAVSPVSITPVTGENLKLALDQKNIVWSNMRDYGYSKFDNGVELTLETIRHRRQVVLRAIKEMLALRSVDAMFLYFEDIDVILHAWMGVPTVHDELVDFLSEFDQELGGLLSNLPAETNLVVMGDHGMSAIQYELNARSLLPPGAASNFMIRTSGGAMLLYPPGRLDDAPPEGLDLEATAQALRDVRVEFDGNRKVFKRVILRDSDEAKSLGLSGNKSPWILAFAEDGISLLDRLESPVLLSRRASFVIPESLRSKYPDPMNSGTLIQPTPLGAHGHDSAITEMKTHLVMLGPELSHLDLASVTSSTQVVPAVAQALGWVKPASCQ